MAFGRLESAPGASAWIVRLADRRTWAPHGLDGWYIGTAPEHY